MLIGCCGIGVFSAHAQTIDAASHRSIVEALQDQVLKYPSAFPMESYTGGPQPVQEGLKATYFGYGERRYKHRTDFHPAMDLAYFPTELGDVTTEQGDSVRVRAPQTYLKKVYAIQKGVLVSFELKKSGYKAILRHSLEKPYYDAEGRPYYEYFTCYRHLDSRSLAYLSDVAKKSTGDKDAGIEDLFGNHVFEAGEQIALVGFSPNYKRTPPRVHLDFSLNLFNDPDKGSSIRKYAVNPLLLFPPFAYGDPRTNEADKNGTHAYRFAVDRGSVVAPTKDSDGRFRIEIHAGGASGDGSPSANRYFALNAMDVSVLNGGKNLGSFTLDRHRKLGYDTLSYKRLDSPDESVPHFSAPLGEQQDVFRIDAVLPAEWLDDMDYDWSKPGSLSIKLSSIWDGYLDGHILAVEIPLGADTR